MEDQNKQLDRIENMVILLFEMQIALMEEICRSRCMKDAEAWKEDIKVKLKDKVKAGETVIAEMRSEK